MCFCVLGGGLLVADRLAGVAATNALLKEECYFLTKTELPVLEIEVDRPGTLMSEYRWAP